MGLLQGIIPQQNFELVRDRIAQVLALELTDQAAMYSPAISAPTVFTNRLRGIDESELAVINISLQQGDYDNKDAKSVDGTYLYNIDVYTAENDTSTSRGDTLAAEKRDRIIGQCRAILENPQYMTLGFERPSVSRVWVAGVRIPENQNLQEASNGAQGRLEFYVKVTEGVELITPNIMATHFTTVKMSTTDKGYLWGTNSNTNNIEKARDMKIKTYTVTADNSNVNGDGVATLFTDDLPNNAIVNPLVFINNDGVINNWSAQGITRNTSTKQWNFTAFGGVTLGSTMTLMYEVL